MKSVTQNIIMILLVLAAAAVPVSAEDSVEPAEDGVLNITKTDAPPPQDPITLETFSGTYQWSSYFRNFGDENHDLIFSGGLVSHQEMSPFGDDLQTGMFQTGFTYRYKGLFNGRIRPVARFSVGTGQQWSQTGGEGFGGYASGMQTYAKGEAGVEVILVRYKGYGVGFGVTEAYVVPIDAVTYMRMNEDDITGAPYGQQGDFGTFSEWITNFYPVFETPGSN